MPANAKPLRADALRNRDKLLATAIRLFGERGLDVPLEEIARQAKVSIGTLYNHFPTRGALYDAILPERIVALDQVAERALAEPDAWDGFVAFIEGLFVLQAQDRGLNDALAQRFPLSDGVREACAKGFQHVERLIARAKDSGQLRADFEAADLATLIAAMSQVILESADTDPPPWRRCLAFFLDGLRAEAARPVAATAR